MPREVSKGVVHKPVLVQQAIEVLDLRPGHFVVDGTVGAANHAMEFLPRVLPGGFLLGLDRDPQVAELAVRALISAGYTRKMQWEVEVWRFSQLEEALARRHTPPFFDRLFLDIGVCSLHLDLAERGFSLKRDGPLDMRMNPHEPGSQSAEDVVNEASEQEMARIFLEYGEERFARRVARRVVEARRHKRIRTTGELREVVAAAIPRKAWPPQVDPATRVFQALRIAVNEELEELDAVLEQLPRLMRPGARAAIITFHSLEDRRVKQTFRELSRGCICPPEHPVCVCGRKPKFRVVTRKALVALPEEVAENPRSRSAKIRCIERL